MAAQWFKVTAPNGDAVWLNPDQCSRVRHRDSTVAAGALSVIDGGFGSQAVKETVDTIMKVLSKC
jgi:hypothetical protein